MKSSLVKHSSKQEIENVEVIKKPVSTEKIEISSKSKETESRIKVFIRKRPLLPSEMGKNDLITVPSPVCYLILPKNGKQYFYLS